MATGRRRQRIRRMLTIIGVVGAIVLVVGGIGIAVYAWNAHRERELTVRLVDL